MSGWDDASAPTYVRTDSSHGMIVFLAWFVIHDKYMIGIIQKTIIHSMSYSDVTSLVEYYTSLYLE
jgi:hypothetical protein